MAEASGYEKLCRMSSPVRVLAIESSCDETAVSVVAVDGAQVQVTQNLVTSQVPIHQRYGGVVPEVAARSHVPETVSLLQQAINAMGKDGFDVIAVTQGPGLPTALSVGVEAARTLAWMTGKPLIGVNHLEGHLASAWLNPENRAQWEFPLLALVVSGGHTELVLIKDFGDYEIVGETRDDAAGEAFDKAAKLMGLPYPGGPQISRLAQQGNAEAFAVPRPMLDDPSLDFSFSGLKTFVRYTWEELKAQGEVSEQTRADLAASTQKAIVEVLCVKTLKAALRYQVKGVLLVGGVSANRLLREELGALFERSLPGVAYMPSDLAFITDNAAMIAAAGYWQWKKGNLADWREFDIQPDLNFPRAV